MSEHIDTHPFDEQVVTFADHLLEDRQREVELSNDPELRALQETMRWLADTIEKDQPEPAMVKRIHANLVAEWGRANPQPQSVSFWERLKEMNPFQQRAWQSRRSAQRTLVLGFAYAAVAVLVLGLLLVPVLAPPTTATAGGQIGYAFFALIGVVFVIVTILWWLTRSKG